MLLTHTRSTRHGAIGSYMCQSRFFTLIMEGSTWTKHLLCTSSRKGWNRNSLCMTPLLIIVLLSDGTAQLSSECMPSYMLATSQNFMKRSCSSCCLINELDSDQSSQQYDTIQSCFWKKDRPTKHDEWGKKVWVWIEGGDKLDAHVCEGC